MERIRTAHAVGCSSDINIKGTVLGMFSDRESYRLVIWNLIFLLLFDLRGDRNVLNCEYPEYILYMRYEVKKLNRVLFPDIIFPT